MQPTTRLIVVNEPFATSEGDTSSVATAPFQVVAMHQSAPLQEPAPPALRSSSSSSRSEGRAGSIWFLPEDRLRRLPTEFFDEPPTWLHPCRAWLDEVAAFDFGLRRALQDGVDDCRP